MAHTKITVSIPDDTVLERARIIAERQGRSLSAVIYRALRDAVILDEGARAAVVGGYATEDETIQFTEEDAEAIEADYQASAHRGRDTA